MEVLTNLLHKYPALDVCKADIGKAFLLIKDTYQRGGKLLVCGNGGSAADSEHIVGELMKGFMLDRKISESARAKIKEVSKVNGDYIGENLQGALPAISLVSHTALISAFSNDMAPDMIFAQQVFGYGKPEDSFLGLSTSGNSKNVIYAAETAKAIGMHTIAFTGKSGGSLKDICDCTVLVPSESTPVIQEYHLPVYHALCMMLECEFFMS